MDKAQAVRNIQAGIVDEPTVLMFQSMELGDKILAVLGSYKDEHGDLVCANCGRPNETCECFLPDDDFDQPFDDGEVELEQALIEEDVEIDPMSPYCEGCGRSHDLCDCPATKK